MRIENPRYTSPMALYEDLLARGLDATNDPILLKKYSRDTSIFERSPQVIVRPKDQADVVTTVKYAAEMRAKGFPVFIAPRAAGTDMSGGPLTDSIVLSFTETMNRVRDIGPAYVVAEPGIFYRDLEKKTLAASDGLIPSYPASRELCALGGMIGNNSGGELTLRYGKTADFTESLDVVLADGTTTTFRPLSQSELAQKEAGSGLEADIYRKVHDLIMENHDEIEAARPIVTKNSAGYSLWDVWNDATGLFDLTKLIVGSQGTLAIVTAARMKLMHLKPHKAMLVVFLNDIHDLPEVVKRVMKFQPESFESYDDQTFKLAIRFLPQIIGHFGILGMIRLGLSFLPEMWMVLTGGVPKLILMAEFAEDDLETARGKAREARHMLADLPVQTKLTRSEMDAKKYWIVRREAFALLRKNLRGFYASPFIDDCVVPVESLPEFIPQLNKLLKEYDIIYTIQGHIGNGNFHIIPLMKLSDERHRKIILELTPRVYDLVSKFHGSTTGEHNDGLIRTPYLKTMFSPKMLQLFQEVKNIFDPYCVFNPGKKVGGTEADIERFMIKSQ
jgi:FAD/FMN-containing dehydrogenase